MKLWQKKKTSVTEQVDRFTVGADRLWDVRLAPYDVLASKAHAQMLASVGLLTEEEAKQLCDELDNIMTLATQEDFVIEDDFEDVDVPFAVIEDVPIFPGCEKVAKSKRRECFQDQINKHIRKNFRYPEIAQEMGIQGRVYVNFIISKDGSISNIRMRGPDKNLEKEAARIIGKLPSMTPGKQRGRPVRVPFSIPITFILQ